MQIREERPSYVTFERKQIEDRARSVAEGRYIAQDVDFAIITPIGSKDRIPRQVDDWLKQLEQQAREGRIPQQWVGQYKSAYEAWKRGEEPPLAGTPIKGWALLSPAQQANVIGANILTVEDLAQANDEAQRRIGMGSLELRDKAIAWLKAAKDLGPVTQENAAMRVELRTLQEQVNRLEQLNKQQSEEITRLRRQESVEA